MGLVYTKLESVSISWHARSKSGPVPALDSLHVAPRVSTRLVFGGFFSCYFYPYLYASVNRLASFQSVQGACTVQPAFKPSIQPACIAFMLFGLLVPFSKLKVTWLLLSHLTQLGWLGQRPVYELIMFAIGSQHIQYLGNLSGAPYQTFETNLS